MSHPTTVGVFVEVNPAYKYSIRPTSAANVIHFDSQTDGKWLAHRTGANDFRVLAPGVVVKMLNQALEHSFIVIGTNKQTKKSVVFETRLAAKTAKVKKLII